MKRLFLLAILWLAAAGWAAATEAFDPMAPVTLDLRDASLTDVITTLGAMANLPVVIEPGIEGRVTIKMEKVPFVKILGKLSWDNRISIRVKDGKLIASRILGAADTAPVLPEKFREAPRILLANYASSAANPPPLLISTRWNGEDVCTVAKIGNEGGGLLEIPLSKSGTSEVLIVADMGYDPVLKTRAIALETADGSVKLAYSLGPEDKRISLHRERALRLLVSQSPRVVAGFAEKGDCGQLVFQPARGGSPVTVSMEFAAVSGSGAPTIVFAPRIRGIL